jgi:hypothetical protein
MSKQGYAWGFDAVCERQPTHHEIIEDLERKRFVEECLKAGVTELVRIEADKDEGQ